MNRRRFLMCPFVCLPLRDMSGGGSASKMIPLEKPGAITGRFAMKWWVALIIGLVLGIVATLLAMAGGWFDPRQGYDRQKPADGGQTGPVSHPPKDEWGSFPLRPKTELQDDG